MASWSQPEQASRWPPSAAVRQRDRPQHLELLVAEPGAVLFPEAVSLGPRMSATSTAGRTIELFFR